jgi:hypothetical protein
MPAHPPTRKPTLHPAFILETLQNKQMHSYRHIYAHRALATDGEDRCYISTSITLNKLSYAYYISNFNSTFRGRENTQMHTKT